MSLKSDYSKYLNKFNHFCKGIDKLTNDIESFKKTNYPEKRFPEHKFKPGKDGKYQIIY